MPDVTTGQVAHWKFREGVGTSIADVSGNSFTAATTNAPIWVEGNRNLYAMNFDGANQYAENTTVGAKLRTSGTNDFTFFVRFRFEVAGRNDLIIWKSATASREVDFYVNAASQLEFYSETGAGIQQIRGGTALSINTWYSVALTKVGTTYLMYVDGVVETMTPILTNTVTLSAMDTDRVWLASNHDNVFAPLGLFNLDGQMENARIYTRGLPQADITYLHDYPALTTFTVGSGNYSAPLAGSVMTDFFQAGGVGGATGGGGGGGYARINYWPAPAGLLFSYTAPLDAVQGDLTAGGPITLFNGTILPSRAGVPSSDGVGGTVTGTTTHNVNFAGGTGDGTLGGGGSSAGIAAAGVNGSGASGGISPLGGGNGGNTAIAGFTPGGGGGNTATRAVGKIRIWFTPTGFDSIDGRGGGRILMGLSLAL